MLREKSVCKDQLTLLSNPGPHTRDACGAAVGEHGEARRVRALVIQSQVGMHEADR